MGGCSPWPSPSTRKRAAWGWTTRRSCSSRPSCGFEGRDEVDLISADLAEPLGDLGRFEAVVSSFAIHHLEHERKRQLYAEVFALLEPGGVFANLEHVASPTERLHLAFFDAIGEPIEDEDPSDRTVDVESQLRWLREAGFDDVDCHWKWLEIALLVGVKG